MLIDSKKKRWCHINKREDIVRLDMDELSLIEDMTSYKGVCRYNIDIDGYPSSHMCFYIQIFIVDTCFLGIL